MGEAYGRMLKETGFKPHSKSSHERLLGTKSRELVEDRFPEIMDEIRGISDGAGLDFESLSDFILIHPLMSKAPGCTSFAVNQDGSTWVGRNYDMYYWLKKDLEIYFTAPKGGYLSLGQTDIMVGREDGVNEKGLYAALHGIPSGFVPGVHFWISVRYILDMCRTVEAAVDYLEETQPHCGYQVLLADPSETMAVVEVHPERARVRWPEENYIVTTNHLNHPEMREYTIMEPPDSWPRYNKCMEMLSKMDTVDEHSIQSILSGHEGLVCSYLNKFGVGTLYSTVTNLNTRRVLRAVGHPCTNPYVTDTRLMGA
jgi:predicted choloylglycine hydrolase